MPSIRVPSGIIDNRSGPPTPTPSRVLPLLVLLTACDPEPAKPPTEGPDPSVETTWHRPGLGEAWALAAADLDGDGSDEILYGGRTVAALDADSRARHPPRWTLDWLQTDRDIDGNDNTWATALVTFDATGDEVPDVLAVSVDNDAHLVDGATGEPIWSTRLSSELFTTQVALFDGDADGIPDLFPNYGNVAYSGATGEELWSYDFPSWPLVPMSAEVDGTPGRDLIVASEVDGGVGGVEVAAEDAEIAVRAFSSDGTVVWEYAPAGMITCAAAADLDDDGLSDVYLGQNGVLNAAGPAGTLWELALGGPVVDIVTVEVDGDGRPDAVVSVIDATTGTMSLQAVSAAGAPLWNQPIAGMGYALAVVDADGDGAPEIAISGGSDSPPAFGWTALVEPDVDAETRIRWIVDTRAPAAALSPAHVDGADVLLAGLRDGRLAALDPETGTDAWSYSAGHFIRSVAATDLDGDSVDDPVHGDDGGYVVRTSLADGSELWARPLDAGVMGTVFGVVAGPLDGEPGIVATGVRYGDGDVGVVTRFDADGEAIFQDTFPEWPSAPVLADLDGDGTQELVFAVTSLGRCSVRALDAAGTWLWETYVADCYAPRVAAGDTDGDGDDEIAYGDVNLAPPMHVAMLDGTGTLTWTAESFEQDTYWTRAILGGVVTGGNTTENRGHVTLRGQKDGATLWTHVLEPGTDADGLVVPAGVRFGEVLPDLDGDEVPELGIGSVAGDVRILAGADGTASWITRLEPDGLPWFDAHQGGPMVWVPAHGAAPAWLAVGQYDFDRSKARAFALDADGGILGSVQMRGESHGIAAVQGADGSPGVVVAGGLGLYALGVTVEE